MRYMTATNHMNGLLKIATTKTKQRQQLIQQQLHQKIYFNCNYIIISLFQF